VILDLLIESDDRAHRGRWLSFQSTITNHEINN